MIIQHNMEMLNTSRQYKSASKKKEQSMERIASGYSINRAADDAAGLGISEKMRFLIRGLDQGAENVEDGISFCQVADGALGEVQSMLQRIRELSIQASNDTNTEADRKVIDDEIQQLKGSVDSICKNTEFNDIKIFYDPYMPYMDTAPDDLQIFNATYDQATGDVSYGGIIFQGNRYTWNEISPGMVTTDPITGEQTFVEGEYYFTDPSGNQLSFKCKDGAKPPEIEREFKLEADASGIKINGNLVAYNQMKDENGVGLSPSTMHEGLWKLEYGGISIYFDIPDEKNFDDIVKGLGERIVSQDYQWNSIYAGAKDIQGVDIVSIGDTTTGTKSLQVSNNLLKYIKTTGKLELTIRADNSGVWLEDTAGTAVGGSKKTWTQLGINSWNSGGDINESNVYKFEDTDTGFQFEFQLSNETSVDSVIDGLDGVKISELSYKTSDATNATITTDSTLSGLINGTMTSCNNKLELKDEIAYGRDFDQQTDDLTSGNLNYDKINQEVELEFFDKNGNLYQHFTGSTSNAESDLTKAINQYINFVEKMKKDNLLIGKTNTHTSLTELLGNDKITTSGYLDKVVELTGDMKKTSGTGSFDNGVTGLNYPAAEINFSGFGTDFFLEDLLGLGFNSTCKTCNNHYSVNFVNSVSGSNETTNGYKYEMTRSGSNYTLNIDINSLRGKMSDGVGFTEALIEILDEGGLDEHYTQYAAKDGKLYIFDDRSQNTPAPEASFDTYAYGMPADNTTLNLTVQDADGNNMSFEYKYNYNDLADEVEYEMVVDPAGDYMKSPTGVGYVLYDGTSGVTRYKIQQTSSVDAARIKDYVQNVMDKIATKTEVNVEAQDYAYVIVDGDENYNVAVESVFDNTIDYYNGLHIQASSDPSDCIIIGKSALNLGILGITDVNTKNHASAEESIGKIDNAIQKVSKVRTKYGTDQNRLEHIHNSVTNTAENTSAAESRIRDTDITSEVLKYSRNTILAQVGEAMLAQGKNSKENAVKLLQF